MDDLLKNAIADAKAVRETALENAKVALQEAFTPRLNQMLSQKIQSEVDDDIYEEDEEDAEEEAEEEEAEAEADDEAEMDAEEADEEAEEEAPEEEPAEEEPVEEEEEEEAGEEEEDEEEEEDDLDLEAVLRELEAELNEEEDDEGEDYPLEDDDEVADLGEPPVELSPDDAALMPEPSDEEGELDLDAPMPDEYGEEDDEEEIDLEEVLRALQEEDEEEEEEEEVDEISTLKAELGEHREVVKYLRSKLNEVNLLNAKLLFTNKLFRSHSMTNEQKIKVIEQFDRAKNLREVKLVFSTIAESYGSKAKSVNESNKGSSSKPVASTKPKSKAVLAEGAELKERFQKLAKIL